MRKIFCDCCKREIKITETLFSLNINRMSDKEIVLDDLCCDCYRSIKSLIDNIKSYRDNEKSYFER